MFKIVKVQSGHYAIAFISSEYDSYFLQNIQIAALLNISLDTYAELTKRYNSEQFKNVYIYQDLNDAKGVKEELESIECLNTLVE